MNARDELVSQPQRVAAHFDREADNWDSIYGHPHVLSQVIRDRQQYLIDWIDALQLAAGARVLDLGCGAGYLTEALARRRFLVHAVDVSPSMSALTRRRVDEIGLGKQVVVETGDAHALCVPSCRFNLVVANGLLPWVESHDRVFLEMVRVTRNGGYVLVSATNSARLPFFTDPRLSPAYAPLKRLVRTAAARFSGRELRPAPRFHSRRELALALRAAGLIPLRHATQGFGPLTFLGFTLMPPSLEHEAHRRLQRLADSNVPLIRAMGMNHLLLGQKSGR